MLRTLSLACAVSFVLLHSTAEAHYLWLNLDQKSGDHGTTNLYFEGGPGPGDGKYLDPFIERGTTWVRTIKNNKPVPLEMAVIKKPGKRWLASELKVDGPRCIDSFCKWGVYRYGKTDVLLHYYAKHFDAKSVADKNALARAEQLDLDIVPTFSEDGVELQVLWKGKPAAGRPFKLRGFGGLKKNLTTDEEGRVRFKPLASGFHSMRTSVDEPDNSGTFDGKDYDIARHHCSLTVNLTVAEKSK
jgi:hypothetical protein